MMYVKSPVCKISFPNGSKIINAIPILPTSPAKHFASPFERKLKKLRTFYENSPEEIKAKSYTELDIRFKGQVIGRK